MCCKKCCIVSQTCHAVVCESFFFSINPPSHGKFRASCSTRSRWCSASQVGTATSWSQQPQPEEPISDEHPVRWRCRLSGLAGVTSESITPKATSQKKKKHPLWCQRLNRNRRARRSCRRQWEERVMAGRHAGRRRAASPLRFGGGFRDYRFISRWMAHIRMDWIFWGVCGGNCNEWKFSKNVGVSLVSSAEPDSIISPK